MGWEAGRYPSSAKEAPSTYEVRLTPLNTNLVFPSVIIHSRVNVACELTCSRANMS